MLPCLQAILGQISVCRSRVGIKNNILLLDLICVISDSAQTALQDPALIPLFLPAILKRLSDVDEDDDPSLFPILECITSLSSSLGVAMQPHSQTLFVRAIRILTSNIEQNRGGGNGEDDPPAKDFAICALDLISGMVEGLGTNFFALCTGLTISTPAVGTSPAKTVTGAEALLAALPECLVDDIVVVRSSALAVVGELAVACPEILIPHATSQLFQCIIQNLQLDENDNRRTIFNNACWSCGLLALAVGSEAIMPFLPHLCHALVDSMRWLHEDIIERRKKRRAEENNNQLPINMAIVFGRLSSLNPAFMAQIMNDRGSEVFEYFGEFLCLMPNELDRTSEQAQTWRGFLGVLGALPSVVMDSMINMKVFLEAAAAAARDGSHGIVVADPEIRAGVAAVLMAIKGAAAQVWKQTLTKEMEACLQEYFV